MRKRLFSVMYMFVLTLVFTGLVSAINAVNQQRIERNQNIKLHRVTLRVLDMQGPALLADAEVEALYNKRIMRAERRGAEYFAGLSEDGTTVCGYVFPLVGPGFWGPVYGMIAVDARLERVLGLAFYRHSETPGLGGRITEPWFAQQFKNRKLAAGPPYFLLRQAGTAEGDNVVDAITGATGTSSAVERLINATLSAYLPLFRKAAGKRKG